MFHVKRPPRHHRSTLSALYLPSRPAARSEPGNHPINALSALLAIATGVIHASLAPILAMGDVRPNLILAAVVAATALFGLGTGATWAFISGLTANLLTTDPLGTIPLGLLLVAGLVHLIGLGLGRRGVALALIGGVVGSVVLDVLGVAVLALQDGLQALDMTGLAALIVPTALVNGLLCIGLFVAARGVAGRVGYERAVS
jgi:cell shape-determining protein MreD